MVERSGHEPIGIGRTRIPTPLDEIRDKACLSRALSSDNSSRFECILPKENERVLEENLVSVKLRKLGKQLSPENPIRSAEFLRGRQNQLQSMRDELQFFGATPFVFGNRGVGKTSLARTAAQLVTKSDREHVYTACAPNMSMLSVFKDLAVKLLSLAVKVAGIAQIKKTVAVNLALNPSIKWAIEHSDAQLPEFDDVASAVRTLRDLDQLLPDARETVVIIDELEELNEEDRKDLAFLIKQVGDQDFQLRFILAGIAGNVHELIGVHESVPRYLKEVHLDPLSPQVLMDIVAAAAEEVEVSISPNILIRIAQIGNGYPHFAHLMGKTILIQAIRAGVTEVTRDVYAQGVRDAVSTSIEELRISYEAATQRGTDLHKHLVWALADSDAIDVRTDDWERLYRELAKRQRWSIEEPSRIARGIQSLSQGSHGKIVINTPRRYGSGETIYRHKRFAKSLMRGHVRLQAEAEGVKLADKIEL